MATTLRTDVGKGATLPSQKRASKTTKSVVRSAANGKFLVLRKPFEGSEANAAKSAVGSMTRIVPVIAHAVAVFGDEHKASHWLRTPLELLNNQSPSQLLVTSGGVKRVEQILTRIEHNIPS